MTNTVKPWTMTGTCAGEQITPRAKRRLADLEAH